MPHEEAAQCMPRPQEVSRSANPPPKTKGIGVYLPLENCLTHPLCPLGVSIAHGSSKSPRTRKYPLSEHYVKTTPHLH